MEDLFELCNVVEHKKRFACLVCDKKFITTASWRTCDSCRADRYKREMCEQGHPSYTDAGREVKRKDR